MRRLVLTIALAMLGSVLPLAARGSGVPVATVVRYPAAGVVAVPAGALLAGVTWTAGSPVVSLRTLGTAGWSSWQPLGDDLSPSAGTRAGTSPVWLGGASAVEVAVVGEVAGAELVVVGERLSSSGGGVAHASTGTTRLGRVIARREWGAAKPADKVEYAPRIDAIAIHHTVNSNDYTAAEVPAMVRAIQAYHQKGRGYSDIAYNLLVDRFGRVYEGRAGGIDRAVVGAHTMGFNERVVGVAMLGNLDVAEPSANMFDGVARVAAYLSERWGFDPRGAVAVHSDGSPKYPRGARPRLPRIFGHRDTGATACPGRYVYARLPELRKRTWHFLAPVITGVSVKGVPLRPPEPMTISASLTAPAKWQITIESPWGAPPVVASGTGRSMSLSWNGYRDGSMLPALPGEYRWTATADDGIHGPSDPVSGTFQVGLPN